MKQYLHFITVVLCLFCNSCKSTQGAKAESQGSAPVSGPMFCQVTARLIRPIISLSDVPDSCCLKYPCYASIRIIEVSGCGSGVSVPINAGDTLQVRFAYTLHNTKDVFPAMKVHYPGLKAGDEFTAGAQQRLKVGTDGEFVIYDYTVK
jgi:hypothetical protein